MTVPKPPFPLAARGFRFWRETNATFDLSDAEVQLLAETCRVLDELDVFGAILVESGPISEGSKGQAVQHPIVAALRAHRVLFASMIKSLDLPTADGPPTARLQVSNATSIRATRAARSRWRTTTAG